MIDAQETIFLLSVIAVPMAFTSISWAFPRYTFSPFCKPGHIYQIDAEIEVNGKLFRGSSVHQASVTRRWVQEINGAGCGQTRGESIVFRLDRGRALITGARICREAEQQLERTSRAEVATTCAGDLDGSKKSSMNYYMVDALLIDSADNPKSYEQIRFGEPTSSGEIILLHSAVAQGGFARPSDGYLQVAPALERTSFECNEAPFAPRPQSPRHVAIPTAGLSEHGLRYCLPFLKR